MGTMHVTLVDKNRRTVAMLPVDPARIAGAAIIKYDGRYYVFRGADGRFFKGVTFMETDPPVELTRPTTEQGRG